MICKIFKRGKGSASGIDYLMSANDSAGKPRNTKAELIRGDIAITKKLIAGTTFAQKYTSGVLSWSENPDSMPAEQINQVIESFQNMVCAGLSSERINWLWVKHQDKGRLELHFVIPNVDLITGKRFAPYYDRSDRPLFRAWERLTNAFYGFTNPADPNLKRKAVIPPYLPVDKQQALTLINARMNVLANAGQINSRADVILDLEKIGFVINRAGKDYISIKDKSGKKLRLRGAYYEEAYKMPAKSNASPGLIHDLNALQTEFNIKLQKRALYTAGRYKRPEVEKASPAETNELVITEKLNEGITRVNPGLHTEHRVESNGEVSSITSSTRHLAKTIERFIDCLAKFSQWLELSLSSKMNHTQPRMEHRNDTSYK